MRKFDAFGSPVRQPRTKAIFTARLILVMLLLLVSPVVYEFGNITYSRWESAIGRSRRVETPIIDAIARNAHEFRGQFGQMGTSAFRIINWRPGTIVPMAFGFAALAGWFLKR